LDQKKVFLASLEKYIEGELFLNFIWERILLKIGVRKVFQQKIGWSLAKSLTRDGTTNLFGWELILRKVNYWGFKI